MPPTSCCALVFAPSSFVFIVIIYIKPKYILELEHDLCLGFPFFVSGRSSSTGRFFPTHVILSSHEDTEAWKMSYNFVKNIGGKIPKYRMGDGAKEITRAGIEVSLMVHQFHSFIFTVVTTTQCSLILLSVCYLFMFVQTTPYCNCIFTLVTIVPYSFMF